MNIFNQKRRMKMKPKFPVLFGVTQFLLAITVATVVANTIQHRFDDVESLMDNVEAYTGQLISVAGEVEKVDSHSFVLESGGIIDDEVIVLFDKDISEREKRLVKDGAKLIVEGKVKQGNVLQTEKDTGHFFDSSLHSKLRRVKSYIIASRVAQQVE